jgi:hypothetical protein
MLQAEAISEVYKNPGDAQETTLTKYLEFLNNIIKTDNQQVVFVKNVP